MEVILDGECALLSKTQKKKVRQMAARYWTGDDAAFLEQSQSILDAIHYEKEDGSRYNMIRHEFDPMTNRLRLFLEMVHIETPEEHREKLRKKLHNTMRLRASGRASPDPRWQMYERLKSHLPLENRAMIPTPDQITANLEMYRNMATMIPNHNPLSQYLALFLS